MATGTVSHYRFGDTTFGITRTGKIQGMCNVKYEDERALVADWDETHDKTNPKEPRLVRVMSDGSESQLRPIVI